MPLVVYPRISAYGLNIKPAAVSSCYIYEAGTTTPKTTYSIPAMTAGYEQAHPVLTDANGVFPAIYTGGNFKIIIEDSSGNVIYTDDNQDSRTGDLKYKGTFDSSTNAGQYPVSGEVGDFYRSIETFTLGAASGSHTILVGDFILANKNDATGIDADWNIYAGRQRVLDEDNMVSDNAEIAPSQQSVKAYVTSGTITMSDKTLTNPTITGTVAGGASYTAPTITNPTITGTVAGGASYTAPTITGATLSSGLVMSGNAWPSFRLSGGAPVALAQYSATKLTFSTETFDTNSNVANSRFTPTVAGKYLLTWAGILIHSDLYTSTLMVYKNGALYESIVQVDATSGSFILSSATSLVDANGSGDYFEIYYITNGGSGSPKTQIVAGSIFSGIRAA